MEQRLFLRQGLDVQELKNPPLHSTLEALEAKGVQLSASDRSHLLERLIISLDTGLAVEQAWERGAIDTRLNLNRVRLCLLLGTT